MQFNTHRELEGLHAPFSPSQSHWLRYDDDKIVDVYMNAKAREMGTRLHAWAAETINLRLKQPDSSKAIYAYVNDAIGYKMQTEVVLFYSRYFFGTADTISFRNGMLRIHDLKTGKTAVHMEQLKVYAALFCLEYKVKPKDIEIELRIYQHNGVKYDNPSPEDIQSIMDMIVHFNKILEKIDSEEV